MAADETTGTTGPEEPLQPSGTDEPQSEAAGATPPPSSPPPRIDIIPPEIRKAARNAGVDTDKPEVVRAITLSMMMSGPLPMPSLLKQYNEVIPGLGDKIVDWAEEETKHRRAIESNRSNSSISRMNRGQFIAASVALFGMGLSALVGIFGDRYVAGIIAIVAIGGPTAAVLLATRFGSPKPPTDPAADSGSPASPKPSKKRPPPTTPS